MTGGVAYFTYDALGRVTKAEDEKGNVTCYEYTPNGNLAKVTDTLGDIERYTYDPAGPLLLQKEKPATSLAVAFWGIAFTGKKRDNSCSMNQL